MRKLLSVIIPVYNEERMIAKTATTITLIFEETAIFGTISI